MNEKMIDLIDGSVIQVICFFKVIMPSSVVLESFNRNSVLVFWIFNETKIFHSWSDVLLSDTFISSQKWWIERIHNILYLYKTNTEINWYQSKGSEMVSLCYIFVSILFNCKTYMLPLLWYNTILRCIGILYELIFKIYQLSKILHKI